jgi:hypothetical protein
MSMRHELERAIKEVEGEDFVCHAIATKTVYVAKNIADSSAYAKIIYLFARQGVQVKVNEHLPDNEMISIDFN